jgi:hypothetical protein
MLPKSSVLFCIFLWAKELNAEDIHKEARRARMLRRRLRSRQENGEEMRDQGGRRPLYRRITDQPRTALEGVNQDIGHIWKAEELERKPSMKLSA